MGVVRVQNTRMCSSGVLCCAQSASAEAAFGLGGMPWAAGKLVSADTRGDPFPALGTVTCPLLMVGDVEEGLLGSVQTCKARLAGPTLSPYSRQVLTEPCLAWATRILHINA
jgi:hypothetical protein